MNALTDDERRQLAEAVATLVKREPDRGWALLGLRPEPSADVAVFEIERSASGLVVVTGVKVESPIVRKRIESAMDAKKRTHIVRHGTTGYRFGYMVWDVPITEAHARVLYGALVPSKFGRIAALVG